MKPNATIFPANSALRDGLHHHQAGRHAEAEAQYRSVLGSHPSNANALHLLGVLLHQRNQDDESIELLRRAVALSPRSAEFHNSLGGVLSRTGRVHEAIVSFQRAVGLNSAYAEAYGNLGLALEQLRRFDEAAQVFRRATEIRPQHAEAHHRLGNALRSAGRADEAIDCHRRALALRPEFVSAWRGLAFDLGDVGRADEAVECYREILRLEPNSSLAWSDLLFAMHYSDRYSPADHLQEARRFGAIVGRQIQEKPTPAAVDPNPNRRLRIGYISPDFRRHTVPHIIEPILEAHDRERFEVISYSSVRRPDEVTARLRRLADGWVDVAPMSDDEAADRIRGDHVDVLVDLAGHMGDNRLAILARKPAPIQIQIGYPGPTGLATIDYRTADAHSAPEGVDSFYNESLLRLPDGAWPYKPSDKVPPVGALPAKRKGYVTFGCLNKLVKVSDSALALWCQILQEVPESRLALLSPESNSHLRERLARHRIPEHRVQFLPRRGRYDYLDLFNQIDIALDPFPYHGETTTCDGLWMGVPLITLAGPAIVSRRGASHLSNLGLTQWIAQSPAEYVALAGRTADDIEALAVLRSGLRERMRVSAIIDGVRYTRHLEAAYRTAWKRLCAAEPPNGARLVCPAG